METGSLRTSYKGKRWSWINLSGRPNNGYWWIFIRWIVSKNYNFLKKNKINLVGLKQKFGMWKMKVDEQ